MANKLHPFVVANGTAKYFVDPNHVGTSFVTLSGHYFILKDRGPPTSDKNFKTGVNKCSGNSAFELYNWYTTFTDHCLCFGKYCRPHRPYCCYNNHCTSPRGFSVGTDNSHDVSATFATMIDNDARLIWDYRNW